MSSRSIRTIVLLVVMTLLMTSAPAMAHTQSGDHVGCVNETVGHFNQLTSGTIYLALESESTVSNYTWVGNNRHITNSGWWGGGWWRISGIDPGLGAYVHC